MAVNFFFDYDVIQTTLWRHFTPIFQYFDCFINSEPILVVLRSDILLTYFLGFFEYHDVINLCTHYYDVIIADFQSKWTMACNISNERLSHTDHDCGTLGAFELPYGPLWRHHRIKSLKNYCIQHENCMDSTIIYFLWNRNW